MKITISTFCFILLLFSNIDASNPKHNLYFRTFHNLAGIETFRGDRFGDFKDDIVAVLSDGSAWKIHPKDYDLFINWELNDTIHPECRSSSYYFSRQHHFLLVNNTRDIFVRAMLIRYPTEPLIVINSHVYIVKILRWTNSYTDDEGNYHEEYHERKIWESSYTLSDDSKWKAYDTIVREGDIVYLCCNALYRNEPEYFMIEGLEREIVRYIVTPKK